MKHEFLRFRSPSMSFGDLNADTVARVIAASCDIAIVVDRNGVIRDYAISEPNLTLEGLHSLFDKRFVDIVAGESRPKIEEMLHDAHDGADARWREVNHQTASGTIPVRYIAFDLGEESNGAVIALGRDLRRVAELQQRLLQLQQTLERDAVRLRQAESRYRLLFQMASEAVVIVEPTTKRIAEANPAAARLLGVDNETLTGQSFPRLFHADSRDSAIVLLHEATSVAQQESVRVRLADGRGDFSISASVFRQGGTAHVLVRFASLQVQPPADLDPKQKLLRVLNRIPDAFVVADASMSIIEANMAFLELAHLPSVEAARGQSLTKYVGRPSIDLNVLMANLREHGWVRNFRTILRTHFGTQDEIEISAVTVRDGLETYSGFIMRGLQRREEESGIRFEEVSRSPEQLKELVGRVSLREIVRETTDVIERMCIEAALTLTDNNRASAAEILGLSRQSLYSKLNRYGIQNGEVESGTLS